MSLSKQAFEETVRSALLEDIGSGDITTTATVDPSVQARAILLAKSPLVLCGIDIASLAFKLVDESVTFTALAEDGAELEGRYNEIAVISGSAASILTAERVALNFLQRLSGVATLSGAFTNAVIGTNARIVDTRKTTPGLRVLEKYAVRVGGAFNHRFGLADGVLIKDNHIVAAGGICRAINAARRTAPHTLRIEVEVKSLSQIDEALAAGADIILLDNMSNDELMTAVKQIGGRAITEASGGVNLTTVRAIAETGVDLISVGALTHSAPAVDISLDFTTDAPTIGQSFHKKEVTTSTNDDAKKAVAEGVPEGSVFTALHQSAGRGRRGTAWIAESGKSVLMTVVLYPQGDISTAWRLGWIACLAVVEALKSFKINASVKWPNDVVVDGKKIAGILIETVPSPNHPYAALVGIGVNVLQESFDDVESYRVLPTSIAIVLGSKKSLVTEVIERTSFALDKYYSADGGNWDTIVSEYKKKLITGQNQSGIDPVTGDAVTGIFVDIRSSDGAGELLLPDSEIRFVYPESSA